MKSNYVGTQIEDEQHRQFGIVAATKRTTRTAILRELIAEFLIREQAGENKPEAQKEATV